MTLLGSSIWVVLPTAANDDTTMLLRFAADGQYLHGQTGANSPGGMAGVEYGIATTNGFDVYGYTTLAFPSVDTNGEWGMSHPLACDRFRSVGDGLIFTEDFTTPFTCANSTTDEAADKADNNPTGIVGVWALGSATVINTQHLAFFPDGKFLMVDPIGDTDPAPCGGPGVETGSYAFNATTGTLSVSNATHDTNGCAGVFDNSVGGAVAFAIAADGNTATITETDGQFTLHRVSN